MRGRGCNKVVPAYKVMCQSCDKCLSKMGLTEILDIWLMEADQSEKCGHGR